MIPLRDQNPSFRTPVVVGVLLVANVALFLHELALGPALRSFVFAHGLVPARVSLAVLEGRGSPLDAGATFVTSMFLHGGWAHLVGNMWYLWIFGDNVEDRLGHARFLLFYLGAGVAAGALHWALHPDSTVPTVGASGAIAGVLGAYLRAFPRARVITLLPLFPVFPVVALPAVIVLGLWFVLQLLSGAIAIGGPAAGGGVAWWAHVGGFVFGLLLAPGRPREAAAGARGGPRARAW